MCQWNWCRECRMKPEISHSVASDQRPAIHDFGKALQTLRESNAIDSGRDAGKRAEHTF